MSNEIMPADTDETEPAAPEEFEQPFVSESVDEDAARPTTDAAPHGAAGAPVSSPIADGDADGEQAGNFADMDLQPEILQALEGMGYERPMKVQLAVFDHMTAGKDVMVQSRTGTGKTAGFGIPIAQMLSQDSAGAQVLILAPIRELALQVSREIAQISSYKGLLVQPVYGGAPIKPQIDALAAGAQIVVGTPGRVLDHLRRGTLKPSGIRLLVLDECDEMLSMGFQEEIEKIIDFLPPKDQRQTVLFSATIPEEIQRIARRHMNDPEEISLSVGGVSVEAIEHYYYVVTGMSRTRDLLSVMRAENPESALIFCNTREDTSTVAKFLRRQGYDAEAISSDLTQRDRERVMRRMRESKLRFLVATDVAARGIDISHLSHVVNYTFPESPEVYVHRTGRTGRAGKSGVAISLVGPRELGSFYYLKLIYKIRPQERELPSAEEMNLLLESERYDRAVQLVGEEPSDEYRSLARRVWQSTEGERILGALLQRLLTKPKADATATKATAELQSEDKRSRRREDSRREDSRREDSRREDSRREDSRREDSRREDSRREDSRREDSRQDDNWSDPRMAASPSDSAEDSRDSHGRRRRRGESERRSARAQTVEDIGDARTESTDAGDDSWTRQPSVESSRPSARVDQSADKTAHTDSNGSRKDAAWTDYDDDETKEFWETWADEKAERRGQTQRATEQAPRSESVATTSPRSRSTTSRRVSSTRLYVNLGKREGVSAGDIRQILGRGISTDDADKIGAVAMRNTHCYVRVPDDVADKVIAATNGKYHDDRELVVERARR